MTDTSKNENGKNDDTEKSNKEGSKSDDTVSTIKMTEGDQGPVPET